MTEPKSLIIVDDEAIIRDGLREMVDWNALGFRVSACFEDGREALDYLDRNHVDVVLTDIIMDEVSGLEIARNLHERGSETRVVILSGHREFSYAQDAIVYHAYRYLLKPVDFRSLESVFASLSEEIEGSMISRSSTVLAAARRQFYGDLATGKILTRSRVVERANELAIGVDPERASCSLVALRIRGAVPAAPVTEAVRGGVVRSVGSAIPGCELTDIVVIDDISVLLAVDGRREFRTDLERALNRGIESVHSAFQVSISADIIFSSESLVDLHASDPAGLIYGYLERKGRFARNPVIEGDPILARVERFLQESFASPISLGDVATLAGLSQVYFSKYFKEHAGIKFSEYLSNLRVRKAIALLRAGGRSIREVGALVGYPNPRYFARVFGKKTGCSPRNYRKSLPFEEA